MGKHIARNRVMHTYHQALLHIYTHSQTQTQTQTFTSDLHLILPYPTRGTSLKRLYSHWVQTCVEKFVLDNLLVTKSMFTYRQFCWCSREVIRQLWFGLTIYQFTFKATAIDVVFQYWSMFILLDVSRFKWGGKLNFLFRNFYSFIFVWKPTFQAW